MTTPRLVVELPPELELLGYEGPATPHPRTVDARRMQPGILLRDIPEFASFGIYQIPDETGAPRAVVLYDDATGHTVARLHVTSTQEALTAPAVFRLLFRPEVHPLLRAGTHVRALLLDARREVLRRKRGPLDGWSWYGDGHPGRDETLLVAEKGGVQVLVRSDGSPSLLTSDVLQALKVLFTSEPVVSAAQEALRAYGDLWAEMQLARTLAELSTGVWCFDARVTDDLSQLIAACQDPGAGPGLDEVSRIRGVHWLVESQLMHLQPFLTCANLEDLADEQRQDLHRFLNPNPWAATLSERVEDQLDVVEEVLPSGTFEPGVLSLEDDDRFDRIAEEAREVQLDIPLVKGFDATLFRVIRERSCRIQSAATVYARHVMLGRADAKQAPKGLRNILLGEASEILDAIRWLEVLLNGATWDVNAMTAHQLPALSCLPTPQELARRMSKGTGTPF